MAKPDLIDRTALVEELERFKVSVPDPVLRLVVARVIDRVKVQPVVDAPVVRVPVELSCDTCKHLGKSAHRDPCASCLAGEDYRNWEWADEDL